MTEIDKEVNALADEIFQAEQIINQDIQKTSITKGEKFGFSTNLMVQNQRIYAFLRFYPFCHNPSEKAIELYAAFEKVKSEKQPEIPQEVLDILNKKDG